MRSPSSLSLSSSTSPLQPSPFAKNLAALALVGCSLSLGTAVQAQAITADVPNASAPGMNTPAVGAPLPVPMAPSAPSLPQGPSLVTLNFEDAPIATVVGMIAEQGGINIVINDDVKGNIGKVFLTDKTPEEAIQFVARTANLKYQKLDDNTYVIAKTLDLLPVQEAVTPIPVPQVPNTPGVTLAMPDLNGIPPLVGTGGAADVVGQGKKDYSMVRLRNVSPTIMAWWLDPANNPKPNQFVQSDKNIQKFFEHSIAETALDPALEAELNRPANNPNTTFINPYAPSTQASSADNGDNGLNGFVQPYTEGNAQFGRRGGGGNNGNNGGGRQGGGRQGGGRQGGGGGGAAGVFELPEGVESITAIDPQNALLVFGTAEGVDRLNQIIAFLDRPLRQVEIEAQFVAVNTADTKQFGINFSNSQGSVSSAAGGFAPAVPTTGSFFQLGFARNNFQAILRTLTSQSRAKVVNSPRVTAINNLTASLVSRTSTPFLLATVDSGVGGGGSVIRQGQRLLFITTSIELTVTPTINNDDTITVVMRPQFQTQTPNNGGLPPSVATQFVDTVANVRDGDTIALGGLRTKTITRSSDRVPLLSRIPIIGGAFRNKTSTDSDADLIIFLTARILRRLDEAEVVPGT